MTRAGWIAIALLVVSGALWRQRDLAGLRDTTARLEHERQELADQVAALSRQNTALSRQIAALADDDDDDHGGPAESPTVEASPSERDEKLQQDAMDAYVHGQYREAIGLASAAVEHNPQRAWRVIGASQCFLKNRDGAMRAYRHLEAQSRAFLKYVCNRNAVTIP
jgi:hypothetical protein